MKKGSIIIIILIAILAIGGCQACGVQKTLVTNDESVKAAWGEVENQYQRRNDLIGNLVETVKGFANHEKSTLEAVIKARSEASKIELNTDDLTPEKLEEFQAKQGQLSQALGRLMVVQEQYPNIKADAQFLKLQDELTGTENRVATARQRYNTTVQEYNTHMRTIPNNIFAGMFGFKEKGTFKAEAGSEKAPKVQF